MPPSHVSWTPPCIHSGALSPKLRLLAADVRALFRDNDVCTWGAQNKRIWWLDAVVALVITFCLAVYSVPVLVIHRWWRKDFWTAYVG